MDSFVEAQNNLKRMSYAGCATLKTWQSHAVRFSFMPMVMKSPGLKPIEAKNARSSLACVSYLPSTRLHLPLIEPSPKSPLRTNGPQARQRKLLQMPLRVPEPSAIEIDWTDPPLGAQPPWLKSAWLSRIAGSAGTIPSALHHKESAYFVRVTTQTGARQQCGAG